MLDEVKNQMKKVMSALSVLLLFVLFNSGCFEVVTLYEPDIFYVDNSGEQNFTSIQDAIDNASEGDIIFVSNGTYYETLFVHKSITLIGTDNGKTIINYNKNNSGHIDIILITAENCTINGLEIINSIGTTSPFDVMGFSVRSSNNIISNNTILNFTNGIFIGKDATNNHILSNNILKNQYGIYMVSSYNNISKNNISSNSQYGVYLYSSSDQNTVSWNVISDNGGGIHIKGSKNNKIFGNNITNNQKGMYLCCNARDNKMYYNIFKQNSEWNAQDTFNNQWDNGSVGNYWDDYTKKYPDATDADGIWYTAYEISVFTDPDEYPLVIPANI